MVLDGDYRVGDWLVKPHTNTVVGAGGEFHMEPKAMQVLSLLAERAGEVVTKQELLAEVWDGTFVSEEVLPNAVWEIRRVLGDNARKPSFIQTLPKKGYRLIAAVAPPAQEEPPSTSAAGEKRWRRPRFAAAVSLAIALAAGGILALAHRSERARSARTLDDPYPVLVASFENHAEGEELAWLESGAPTMLRTALAEIPGLSVVSDESFERALDRAEPSSTSRLELARHAGAEALVLGSIFRAGGELRIDVQVEDVVEARIVAAHSVRGADVFALMDELTAWVRDTLDIGDAASPPPLPIRDMTTASLEAFRLYNEGVSARRHLRVADAKRQLTEAVVIDPGFALAYLELQWVALWTNDEAGHELYVKKTLEHQDRLPPQKRLLMEAMSLWEKGERDRAERILLDVVEQRPDEEDAYLHLAHLYGSSTPRGLETLERGVGAVPHSGYLRLNYGYGLLGAGRYPEAIHQLERYAEIDPEEPNPWDSLGEAYLIAGVPERALAHYAHALEIDPSFPSSYLGRSWALARLGRYDEALAELEGLGESFPPGYSADDLAIQKAYWLSRVGRYREARALVEAIASSSGETPSPAALAIQALFAIETGAPERALELAEQARREVDAGNEPKKMLWTGAFADLLAGVAATRAGRIPEAEARLSRLRASCRSEVPLENWWVHLLAGEIELARGEARAAYLELVSGEPDRKLRFNVSHLLEDLAGSLSLRDAAARAKAREGDAGGAIAIYEKLLRPDIGQRWTAVLEPRYHLEIGRLLATEGDREEAAKHYRRFLELWSRADRELPELREAEAYLAS